MNRRLAVAIGMAALAVGYLAVPESVLAQVGAIMAKGESGYSEPVRSTNGRMQVSPRSADGGMAEFIAHPADGGMPVALPAGESAADPLFCEAVSDGAAVGAANPLPVGVQSSARGATAAAEVTATDLGVDRAALDVVWRDSNGALGSAANPLQTSVSASTSSTHGAVQCITTAEVSLPAVALSGRRTISVQNLGPNAIYVCTSSTCTTSTGTKIAAGDPIVSFDFGDGVPLWCIAETANQVSPADTRFIEAK